MAVANGNGNHTLTPNMGPIDRIVRGTLGGLLFINGLSHLNNSRIRPLETLVGGAFLTYGLTGFDPLLKKLGASTIGGDEKNILNRLKQAMPGQGINPMLSQQPEPRRTSRRWRGKTVADALAVR